MKQIILPFLFLSLALLLSGCRRLVEDEFPPLAQSPVVNSIIKSGERISINLSFTASFDTSAIAHIDHAEVHLYTDGIFSESLASIGAGNYQAETVAEPGMNYQFEVEIPGFETLAASQYMPEVPLVYDLFQTEEAVKNEEGTSLPSITFSFPNDPLHARYYEVLIHLIEQQSGGPDPSESASRLAFITQTTDAILLQEGLELALFSTENIRDTSYTMTINYTTGSQFSNGGPLKTQLFPTVVEVRSVSFDYYHFVKQRTLYKKGRYPEIVGGVVTAFPLHSNIENGYGIFAGYSAIKSDTIYPLNYNP